MRTQTDMAGIIAVAETFLDREYTYRPSSLHDFDHPFSSSSTPAFRNFDDIQDLNTDGVQLMPIGDFHLLNIPESPEAWELYKKIMRRDLHECKSAFKVFSMITEAYHFEFLKAIMPFLSAKDFSELFGDVWVLGEGVNHTPIFNKKELIELFSTCEPECLMQEEELEVFRNLPDELTVYRGVAERKKNNVRVFSWTLSKEQAEWFSHRPASPLHPKRMGAVYQANIKKENIFAYFSAEEEIIVNPEKLYNIITL